MPALSAAGTIGSAMLAASSAREAAQELATVKGYFQKEQCPGAGQAASGSNGYQITWNKSINATQEMIEGTNIPKSFTIKDAYVNGKEVWVHGNATKHMGEYINSANGSVIVENELMISFQDSVSQILPNVQPGRNFFHINGWEIGINGDTGVIYHALYK